MFVSQTAAASPKLMWKTNTFHKTKLCSNYRWHNSEPNKVHHIQEQIFVLCILFETRSLHTKHFLWCQQTFFGFISCWTGISFSDWLMCVIINFINIFIYWHVYMVWLHKRYMWRDSFADFDLHTPSGPCFYSPSSFSPNAYFYNFCLVLFSVVLVSWV